MTKQAQKATKAKDESAPTRFDMVEVGKRGKGKTSKPKADRLKAYDSKAACPKCRHDVVATRYCPEPQAFQVCGAEIKQRSMIGEHMHRTCERCGFEWLQACLPPAPS